MSCVCVCVCVCGLGGYSLALASGRRNTVQPRYG